MIAEIRAFDSSLDVVVVDDGSADGTTAAAVRAGAHVVRLPFNLGIGGAVQTGFRYAHENGYRLVVRVDGDGQHDAAQLVRERGAKESAELGRAIAWPPRRLARSFVLLARGPRRLRRAECDRGHAPPPRPPLGDPTRRRRRRDDSREDDAPGRARHFRSLTGRKQALRPSREAVGQPRSGRGKS